MEVIKRNNSKEPFDVLKILRAASLASVATKNPSLELSQLRDELSQYINKHLFEKSNYSIKEVSIETIQDYVEKFLM